MPRRSPRKMCFVPIKSNDQLDLQSLHRVRERWVMRRTAVINQIRGLLLERGITMRKGRCHVEAELPRILEDGAWLRQAWKSHARFPHLQPSGYYELNDFCQVCWRTMRWHNVQPGALETVVPRKAFQDCPVAGAAKN
jgi:hypothetical protein